MTPTAILRLVALLVLGVAASGTAALRGVALGLDFRGGARVVYEVQVPPGADAGELTARVRDVIARRLDSLRVAEASVVASESTVAIEFGGLDADEREALRAIVGRRSLLEFVAVDDEWQVPAAAEGALSSETESLAGGTDRFWVAGGPGAREQLIAGLAALSPPAGRVLAVGRHESARSGSAAAPPVEDWRSYVLTRTDRLSGHIREAEVVLDAQTASPTVRIEFDDDGRAQFGELTRRLVNRRMAIVLDGVVQSAPLVRDAITGGSAIITLGASGSPEAALVEASALAATLRSGALPAPIVLATESLLMPTVGATTVLLASAMALGAWLALLFVATLRYRFAGALWLLIGPPCAILLALAVTSVFGCTVSATYCAGLAIAVLWMLASGSAPLELARRGNAAASLGGAAIGGAHLISLSLAFALYAMSYGPLRAFAAGILMATPGAALVAALGATALSALLAPPRAAAARVPT